MLRGLLLFRCQIKESNEGQLNFDFFRDPISGSLVVVQDDRDDWMRGGLLEDKYPSVLSSLPSSVIQRRENFFFGSLLAFQVFCFSLANSDPKNHALYR